MSTMQTKFEDDLKTVKEDFDTAHKDYTNTKTSELSTSMSTLEDKFENDLNKVKVDF